MVLNRISKFLSPYIPSALAVGGISKIDPKLGSFFKKAGVAGFGANQVLDFLREKMSPPGTNAERGILENRAESGMARPEELISHGKNKDIDRALSGASAGIGLAAGGLGGLASAGAEALQGQKSSPEINDEGMDKQLEQLIQKLAADGQPPEKIAEYLRSVYPEEIAQTEDKAQTSLENLLQQYFKKSKKKPNMRQGLQDQFQGQYGQDQQQSQGGPGMQKLMQALQAYQQNRG